jgi:hypothetical protein
MTLTHLIFFTIAYNSQSSSASAQSALIQHYLTGCLLMSLLRDRVSQLVKKLFTFSLITICSWKIKKQRKRSALVFIALNFLFIIPITFGLILPSCLLSAPLLPLFTFPLYLVGFPRVKRFWPQRNEFFSLRNFWNFRSRSLVSQPNKSSVSSKASTNLADANFYAQLVPELLNSFRELVKTGALGSTIRPESFYLSRFQDRILWIQVIESSHSYLILNIKGLELQETSCHTVEAQYIDDTFDLAFENPTGAQANSDSTCRAKFLLRPNPRPFGCMRPRDILVFEAYSDAKSSLVGILDNPETLNSLIEYYPKILHYFLIRFLFEEATKQKDSTSKADNLQRSISNFRVEREQSALSLKRDEPGEKRAIYPDISQVQTANHEPNETEQRDYKEDFVVGKDENDSDAWSDTDSMNLKVVNHTKRKESFKNEAFQADPFDFDLDKILGNAAPVGRKKLPEIKREEKKPAANSLFPSTDFAQVIENPNKPTPKPRNEYNFAKKVSDEPKDQLVQPSVLAIPSEWLRLMNENVNMAQSMSNEPLKQSLMSRAWLEKVIDVRPEMINHSGKDKEALLADYEANFWASHYKFLLKCSHIIGVLTANQINASLNMQAILKLYKGDLPWSPTNEKLTKELPSFQKLLVKAFR